ncbi:hypothetical protein [Methylobacterium sp. Leaf117]|uniref:hypothetical protein n=1 Tax=Methylobacterium sp. Leaf117 TaxID=1736260 RepID=UPI000A9023BC|nr:hypothetical protein [Methylobacterium sp. Leaf117]
MNWQARVLSGVALFALLTIVFASLISSRPYNNYVYDLSNNQNYCNAKITADERKNSKECQGVIYRALDDPATLVNGFTAIITLAMFVVTYRLYRTATQQSGAAISASDAAAASANAANHALGLERAWIAAPTIVIESGCVGNGLFALEFKNTGREPVRGAYVGARLVRNDIFKERDDLEAEVISRANTNIAEFKGMVVVPNGSILIENKQQMVDIPFDILGSFKEIAGMPIPHIVGCIVYGSPDGRVAHHTTFAIPLKEKDGGLAAGTAWTSAAQ